MGKLFDLSNTLKSDSDEKIIFLFMIFYQK